MSLKPLGKTTAPKPKTHKPIYNPSLALQGTKEGKKYLQRIRDMPPYERLMYWITERYSIHRKRFPLGYDLTENIAAALKGGNPDGSHEPPFETPPPWTDDPILKSIFFCNPHKEDDKVNAWMAHNFRDLYLKDKCVFQALILMRLFNFIPTMRRLINAGIPQRLGSSPKESRKALTEAGKLLVPLRDAEEQMFGGAYIIKFFNGMRKVEAALQVMGSIATQEKFCGRITFDTLKNCEESLVAIHGLGPFYVYQFIGDLAPTYVLNKCPDLHTWGFCGPGTARGLLRVEGVSTQANGAVFERRINKPHGWEDRLLKLLDRVNKDLKKLKIPQVHMFNLTGCLCEFDKYERALNNERHLKRGYPGY